VKTSIPYRYEGPLMKRIIPPAVLYSFAVALFLSQAGPSRAGLLIAVSLNTGYSNATHSLLTPYTVDSKYQVAGPGAGTVYPQARNASGLPSSYTPAPSNARWDYLTNSPTSTGSDFVSVGQYDFKISVDLSHFKAATATIQGLSVAADNIFQAVSINGQTVFSRNPTGLVEDFHQLIQVGDLGQGDFHSGLNTVDFQIYNQGFGGGPSPSPAALLVVGNVVAAPRLAVPEPNTLLVAVIGVGGLLGLVKRFRAGQGQLAARATR